MTYLITDNELIRQYQAGQANRCLEILYIRHWTNVYYQCLAIAKDEHHAQDYTHDVFIKAFEQLGRFQGRATFSSWLYVIARHYCLDRMRSNRQFQQEILIADFEEQVADDSDCSGLELTLALQAFDRLPAQGKCLLDQKYRQGLSLEAIATAHQLTIGALKMRLMRARKQAARLYQWEVSNMPGQCFI